MVYICLAAVGLLPMFWVILQRRQADLVATMVVTAGILQFADWIAHGWFELYIYNSGLHQRFMANDSVAAVLSSSGIVPPMVILSEVYLPGWKGAVLNTVILVVMEIAVLRLGVYYDLVWKLWYTAVTFPAYFLAMHWYRQAAKRYGLLKGWPRTAFRVVLAMWGAKIYWAVVTRILELVIFNIHVMPNFSRNQALGMFLLDGLWIKPIFYLVIAGDAATRKRRLALAALAFLVLSYGMALLGLRAYRAPWNPFWETVSKTAWLYGLTLVDDWVGAWSRKQEAPARSPGT